MTYCAACGLRLRSGMLGVERAMQDREREWVGTHPELAAEWSEQLRVVAEAKARAAASARAATLAAAQAAQPDEKTCPDCAETVKYEARVCRFCGYRFGTPASTPARRQAEFHPAPQSSGKATAALVLGICGLVVCPVICSVLAIIFGKQAMDEIDRTPGMTGRGSAKAGLVLGIIGACAWGVVVLFTLAGS